MFLGFILVLVMLFVVDGSFDELVYCDFVEW